LVTGHVGKPSKTKGYNTIVLDYGRRPDGTRDRRERRLRRPDGDDGRFQPFTEQEAQEALKDVLAEIRVGVYVEPSGMTFGGLLDRWLAHISGRVGPNTYDNYELAARVHLKPALGHMALTDLRPLHLQDLYADLLAGVRRPPLSPGSVRLAHVTAHAALRQGVRWLLVPYNVADAADPPRVSRQREMHPLDAAGVATFMATARGSRDESFCDTGFRTGARESELLVLRWTELDLDGGNMRIERHLVKYRRGAPVIGRGKTRRGRRLISLGEQLVARLRAHKREQAETRLRMGSAWHDEGLVFPREDGTLEDPRLLLARFKTLARRAGFPELTIHDMRHTHATLLLAAGVHPKIVQERLGHSSIAVTMDLYSHVIPGLQEAAAARLDDILGVPGRQMGGKAGHRTDG